MMATMSEQIAENETSRDARMGKAIVRGVIIGVPSAIVFLTISVLLITDLYLCGSVVTARIPGVLRGCFAGWSPGFTLTL